MSIGSFHRLVTKPSVLISRIRMILSGFFAIITFCLYGISQPKLLNATEQLRLELEKAKILRKLKLKSRPPLNKLPLSNLPLPLKTQYKKSLSETDADFIPQTEVFLFGKDIGNYRGIGNLLLH